MLVQSCAHTDTSECTSCHVSGRQNLLLSATVGCRHLCSGRTRLYREVLDLLQMGPWARFLLNSTRAALGGAHDGGSAEPDWVVGRLKTAGQAGGGAFGGGRQPIHVFRSYTSRKCTRRCVV